MKPITYREACRMNAPAATCRTCLGPMAYRNDGECSWCQAHALTAEQERANEQYFQKMMGRPSPQPKVKMVKVAKENL
jgi:hypothetical protein